MELHFMDLQKPSVLGKLRPALLFAALWLAASGMLELFSPFAFVGLLPLLVLPFLPQRVRCWGGLALLALTLGFFALRFSAITDGLQMLANRMFTISESCQAYEYDRFPVTERRLALREGLAFLSLATALLVYARGGGVLTAVLLLAQAYFGVTPKALWLILLLLAAALYALPQERLWLHALTAALLIGLLALCVSLVAPEPNVRISGWDEQARDRLALHSIFYERTPEAVEVPQTEETPPPPQELQPNRAVSERKVNVLFYALALLTLLLLFVPAVLRDRAEKKRAQNRAAFDDPDCAAAIRAMYLHSRRWLRLKPADTPQEIAALWLEAAYSDHALTEAQRAQMAQYLMQVEQGVWESATKRERLHIRYRLCL